MRIGKHRLCRESSLTIRMTPTFMVSSRERRLLGDSVQFEFQGILRGCSVILGGAFAGDDEGTKRNGQTRHSMFDLREDVL